MVNSTVGTGENTFSFLLTDGDTLLLWLCHSVAVTGPSWERHQRQRLYNPFAEMTARELRVQLG